MRRDCGIARTSGFMSMSDPSDIIGRTEPEFKWTPSREKAALLLSEDELTDEEIAEQVDIVRSTLSEWKLRKEFSARVQENIDEIRRRIRSRGIAIIENRVRHLQRRHDLMNQVIAERGDSPEMQAVPGGRTGLLVHNVKAIGSGENAERVDLYEVDTGLLKELREHEQQAAKELGQWAEKHDMTSGGEPFAIKILKGVSMDEI